MKVKDNHMRANVMVVTVSVAAAMVVVGGWLAWAGELDPPPGPVGPTMNSLADLYALAERIEDKIDSGGGGGGASGGGFELIDPLFIGAPSDTHDVFMRIDGVAGESEDERHLEWIDVLAVSQNLERTRPQPGFGTVRVLARTDISLPTLTSKAANGQTFPTIEWDFVVVDPPRDSFLSIRLTNALVLSVKPVFQAGAYIVEFDFAKIRVQYTSPRSGDSFAYCWDKVNFEPCPP